VTANLIKAAKESAQKTMKAIKDATEASVRAARETTEASLKTYKSSIVEEDTSIEETVNSEEPDEAENTAKAQVSTMKGNITEDSSPAEQLNNEAIEDATETDNEPTEIQKERKGSMEARLELLAKMYEKKKSQRANDTEAGSE
jgi:hypothetical protein